MILLRPLLLRAESNIEPASVQQIAVLLSPGPRVFGEAITNRAAWAHVAANPALSNIIADAEQMAAQPIPDLTDDLYLDYSRTGNRDRGQAVMFAINERLATLTLAECVENRGRFLPPLQATMEAVCAERSWTYPAHDGDLSIFNGRIMKPDLRATTMAADLAIADKLLGEKLPPAIRQLVRENIRRRVLVPFRNEVEGRARELSWLHISNNWNAVCLGGTVTAALAIEESPEERAWYVAATEKYILYFLRGFGDDGYCFEGVGYWNYGFGHFIMLTEAIRQATSGRIDLLMLPEADKPARFGSRSEIINQVYPSISDVAPGAKPDSQIVRYVRERFDLPQKPGPERLTGLRKRNLTDCIFELFALHPWPVAKHASQSADTTLRTWFPDGGVLIARPHSGDAAQFATVIKGGSNGESHNHNDVGSFSVVLGRTMVICDPGGEVYTRRTFGPQRYDSGVLNSFGHAVPVVAGKLQSVGNNAKAVVLRTKFGDNEDSITFDLRSDYPVTNLTKLERTFGYDRGKHAGLSVRDEVVFAQSEKFESALITWGEMKQVSANELEITDGDATIRIKIDTGGRPFGIRRSLIDEDVHTPKKPTHIGIVLIDPVKKAIVSLTIRPVLAK
jgi:hypothetical protein